MKESMVVFVFKAKTALNIEGSRHLYGLHGISDDDVSNAVFQLHRQQNRPELPYHLLQLITISAILFHSGAFRICSFGDEHSTERDLVRLFFAGIELYNPHPVTWHGNVFDLTIINHRSLLYSLDTRAYWENWQPGNRTYEHQQKNLSPEPHIDLKSVLGGQKSLAGPGLDEMAILCGFPGKKTVDSAELAGEWVEGYRKGIRNLTEIDVLNMYLLYLNWQQNQGSLDPQLHAQYNARVRDELKKSAMPHLIEFENNWIDS